MLYIEFINNNDTTWQNQKQIYFQKNLLLSNLKKSLNDSEKSAKAINLTYVTDSEVGIIRKKLAFTTNRNGRQR